MGTMLSSHIITHHHMIRHASRSWHSNIEVLAYKEENHRNLLNRYIDDSMSMQVCCLLGGTALIIRFPVMPRTYGVATSVPTRYKNVTMSRSRQRGGRPNNFPILSVWPTVPLPAERGHEVHISSVKTNTTDRDSSNCGPIERFSRGVLGVRTCTPTLSEAASSLREYSSYSGRRRLPEI